ncbi:cobyric acid synthase [Paenibacillus sp.]|uniref:cobyric acid synthase n=1 Tax=Paenibacillus sp. TaxID=58172 RepID=UPI002D494D04|nr:cobyric acid synthase [Paenibacillus sp.]HZG83776.1 cobyric acid synthase [Paenibacillus sp.]
MRSAEERLCPTIMVQGTASDVGKSLLVTALCRILANDGYKVAPFKSQNMSLNSFVTPDGKEIGRAQAVQADACRVPATTDMNPILLKPTGERRSQVVLHGKPLRDYDAVEYREKYLPTAERYVREALERLRRAHDVVVMEGAGSPAEVNLRDRDIVNMRAAAWADAPVLLVADIDRGGVFASIVGTMAILRPDERERVKGFIINKFRGDPSLLTSGLEWLEAETGKPVLGVVPVLPDIGLEDEDSASLDAKRGFGRKDGAALDIAVLRLPRMSNFTDVDALAGEPDSTVRFVSRLEEWGEPDAVVIPGTKNTLLDLAALRERGLDERLLRYAREGGRVVGICGGYQMLGLSLDDPDGFESSESAVRRMDGLRLLPMDTVYTAEKRTERVRGTFLGWTGGDGTGATLPAEGYEIHMGRTTFRGSVRPLFRFETESGPLFDGAAAADGRVWGTYLHGVFDNDELRRAWLNALRADKELPPLPIGYRHRERREAAFERLAAHVRAHVNLPAIYEIIGL